MVSWPSGLGIGLQNRVQRFESARDLQNPLKQSGGFCFYFYLVEDSTSQMKNILFLFSLFFGFYSFTQECINQFEGTYHVDISATMPFFEKAAYTENGTIPIELTEMIEGITLNIYADSISLDMSGNKRVLPMTSRISIEENGHCDLLLDMSEMSVPEEAQDMYLTIYVKENKGLQIINSVDPKEMDNYIWRKKK